MCHSVSNSLFASSAIGYLTGLIFSYHFGRIWVFGHKFDINKRNIICFSFVYLLGGLGMSALIVMLNQIMDLDYRICWFFGASFAVVNNFIGLKYFVFYKKEAMNGN